SSSRQARTNSSDCAVTLGTLGQLWIAGCHVNWPAFHEHERCRRVPLPTYPFERERYWVDGDSPPSVAIGPADTEILFQRAALDDWFYTPAWKLTPLPVLSESPRASRWVLFVDECGLGSPIEHELRTSGRDVIVISAADEFRQVSA